MQGSDSYGSSALQHPRIREISSFTYATPAPATNYASGYEPGLVTAWSNGSSESVSSVSSVSSSQSSVEDASDSSSVASNDSADTSSTASSQTSVGSISSQQALDSKLAAAISWQNQQQQQQQQQQKQQQRQHPRRTAAPTVVPSLVRQSERRTTFVDHLVDASTQVVQAIWPLSSVIGRGEAGNSSSNGSYLLPLRTFIQETLRRSRASYSTLQVALYYLVLIKPCLPGHSFTMEQSNDSHACRALQCGRRMFLAALILASKYLQDRNYSARAWSKISGLSTLEINQNETAFLHAVNWRLHITTEVYNRWIECVNKFNLPQLPPSPGPSSMVDAVFERKCADFRVFIQKLSPTLENVDELTAAAAAANAAAANAYPLSPVSMCSSPEAIVGSPMTPPPVPCSTSSAFSPVPSIPRRASQMLAGSRSSMGFAVAQASNACTGQFLDRWPPALANMSSMSSLSSMPSMSSMSPAGSVLTRRSSLANSVSTVSSPESMVSDSSVLSRTSTLSSVSSSAAASWSMVNAPNSALQLPKLDVQVQARHQYGHSVHGLKQQCSMSGLREQYSFGLAARQSETEAEAETAAALALAELQQQTVQHPMPMPMPSMVQAAQYRPRPSLKRSRPTSGETSLLQDNVRDLLRSSLPQPGATNCGIEASNSSTGSTLDMDMHTPRAACLTGSRKRLCRTVPAGAAVAPIATYSYNLNMDLQHPPMSGLSGPGMWQGVLN
ncbi:g1 s-specific cyclin pas1 [Ophiostoma piceae UAMH 11346]|uniref:G1 s-specific cyclin pas1 n=1 Tax=Ophiostoma piceae (strain UAMH 11346) TaxID=1262450 RepID=S3D4V5_OPHP1|nr:g1 s-specific cyclin pas1 [Ophiostoma piceae UAMH 11346]